MLKTNSSPPLAATGDTSGVPAALSIGLARSAADLEEAQRLRYAVFAEELGANLGNAQGRIDRDEYDLYCDHLLVRVRETGQVIGTYRILPPHRRDQVGRLYSESEFDLSRLSHLRPSLIEVGRSCVHPEHRTGTAILMLWAGLAQYMRRGRYRHLIGCASAPLNDGGQQAATLRDKLQAYLSDPDHRVFPLMPFPHEHIARSASVEIPPLIKGYLRLGAKVCGEPAWDPDFNSADFLIWLSLDNLQPRYARHFDLLAVQGEAATV
ncbi:MAG TPA: GNAT family N-acyltransferase [Burkholderiaceae bacterium]|nr:GNAT family N-acyltransferase [Burkholderiaceae bacterium]